MNHPIHIVFAIASSVVVLIAVIWGIALVGSPAAARSQRFDQQRMEDLRTIFREIQSLCTDPDANDELKRPLPASLAALSAQARSERISLTDPETGQPYVYSIENESTYVMCATFSFPRDSDVDVFWNHPAGQHCFSINVLDPPLDSHEP